MIQSSVNRYNDMTSFHGENRCVRDAMELCDIDLAGLSSLLGKTETECETKLNKEMIISEKRNYIIQIFKHTYGDMAPYLTSYAEWEGYIRQKIAANGPAWMEGTPVIEGSSRHFHQIINGTVLANHQ